MKFLAIALRFVGRSPWSICSLITNRSYTDNPTLRGLRWTLLDSCDYLYLLDLHGDSKRREETPTGEADENVFCIQQGVAITTLVRLGAQSGVASVKRGDLWGSRQTKLAELRHIGHRSEMIEIQPKPPGYFLLGGDEQLIDEYSVHTSIDSMVRVYSNGLVTARDGLVIDFDRDSLESRIEAFACRPEPSKTVCKEMGVSPKKGWDVDDARRALRLAVGNNEDWVFPCLYRPFELAWVYYHPAVIQTMASTSWHMCAGENAAILVPRTVKGGLFQHVVVTRQMSEAICLSTKTSVNGNCFPLWLYPGAKERVLDGRGLGRGGLRLDAGDSRTANFSSETLASFAGGSGPSRPEFAELVFFYVAALLHSERYRERYNELLSRGFPRIPRPKSSELLTTLASMGRELPGYYDLDGVEPHCRLAVSGAGNLVVESAQYDEAGGVVWFNRSQCFGPVTKEQWEFMVGDYHVIKRWLVGGRAVSRKGRSLGEVDLVHLSKVLVALDALAAFPERVDAAIESCGGWPGAFVLKQATE